MRLAVALLVALTGWAPAQEDPTLAYVAHAAFRVRSPTGAELLIDPYADRVWLGYDYPAPAVADAILISHPHYDHDGGRYRGLPVPWPESSRLLDAPGEYRVGDIRVVGVPGKHADPYGREFGQINTIWLIEVGGVRLVHVGDNGPLTDATVQALGRVDVLMLPIDGDDHILSREQVETIVGDLAPRVLVPMHYRLPDLEPELDSPSDLGEIEPWLRGRDAVVRLGTHRRSIALDGLPEATTIWVFEHDPAVTPPR